MSSHSGALRATGLDVFVTDDTIRAQAERLAALLIARDWRLVCAESCTGGWIAKACTDIAGSSGWFDSGLVVYSNAAKEGLLGVSAAVLKAHGAVSRETAEAMARGAVQHDNQVSIATTGVAGPTGGSALKPVGLVWFAWCLPGGGCQSESVHFSGDRDAVRRQSVRHAIDGLTQCLGSG